MPRRDPKQAEALTPADSTSTLQATSAAAPEIELLPWEPPQIGSAVDIVHGIRWIRHLVPGSLGHINVWLVPGVDGWVLVDTGMNHPQTVLAWDQLAAAERFEKTLAAVIVTHHHPDHVGMAGELARRFGVPVRMSAPAREAMHHLLNTGAAAMQEALAEFRKTWGVDLEALALRANAPAAYIRRQSGLPPEAPAIVDGERLTELRDPWQASLHFGHAEGHVCLHLVEGSARSDGPILISGDQLLPTISSNISLDANGGAADPLADYFASLDRLDALPADTIVLPAHGRPFRGIQARVAQLRAEHDARLARIVDFAAEPRETSEVVEELFGARALDAMNNLLAHGETLAHIRYLHGRGLLTRVADGNRVLWVRS